MKDPARLRRVARTTKETAVHLTLDPDGRGEVRIRGLEAYTSHLLDSLVRWASMDLELEAQGDLRHHVEEDVGLALGRALREAAALAPVARVGHAVVPMDDALVLAAVDFSGRPFEAVQLEAGSPERHLLRSLAMEAAMNLHTRVVAGDDKHHVDEATFKAVGLALRAALTRRQGEASTKRSVEWG